MSQLKKSLERLKSIPSDYTYDELKGVLSKLGYIECNKGKTSGSRVSFCRQSDKKIIMLHKPHPGNIVRKCTVRNVIENLRENGDLE